MPLDCTESLGMGCGGSSVPPGEDALNFTSGSSSALVHMGETASLSIDGTPLQVHNLRSFYDGGCDSYWDFAYYIVR